MSDPLQIGRYQIERRIGRGGMSVIYLAYDPLMKRSVAIKLLPTQMLDDQNFPTRFQREVETLATLEHPSIVPVYDFGEHEAQPYYVMRFMSGGSLVDLLRKGTLSVSEAAGIIGKIAPGLDAAHRKSIIHRDIKPGNILFDADGNAYLSDFGIVKIASAQSEMSGGAVMGTPAYMSPELARGDSTIDGRSDIYAIGVLLFRMWAGVAPFTASTSMGVAMKHVTDPAPNILDFRPELPEDCNSLIQTAMAKDREDRFSTPLKLSQALNALASGQKWTPEGKTEPLISIPTVGRIEDYERKARKKPDFSNLSNLPMQSTSFIGRRAELARIEDMLANPDCRLLTLLGPGGIGKTRLAIEAGGQLLPSFEHGLCFVSLASVTTPNLIVPTIAKNLRFSFYSQDNYKQQLHSYLQSKEILLILDNFEHLISDAHLISDILKDTNGIKIIVTARERLNLQEEWILPVHGMYVPKTPVLEEFSAYPALELFLDRSKKISPDFELSAAEKQYAVRICQLIEGVPLGIELAAAWVRMLSLSEIASEIEENLDFLTSSLRNVSSRHRSLRAVFNYSWNLLDDSDQEIYRKLAIFKGGFTREAAAHITGASLNTLIAMVDKSLLRKHESGRYEMQGVIQQYAEEKLVEDAEVASKLEAIHSKYYLDLICGLEEQIQGEGQLSAIEIMEIEIENIRLAWRWAIRTSQSEFLAKSFKALYRFYEIRGWLIEGEQTFANLAQVMEANPDKCDENILLCCNAHTHHAAFLYRLGQSEVAHELLHKNVDILRDLDEPLDLAFALTYLGAIEYLRKDYDDGKNSLQESINILANTGDKLGIAIALHHLGLIAREKNDLGEARELFEKSLNVNQEIHNPFGEAISINNLGLVAYEQGDFDQAWALHNSSLDIREKLNDRWGTANSLDGLGLVAYKRKDYSEALYLFEESSNIYREIGDTRRLQNALAHKAVVEALLANN